MYQYVSFVNNVDLRFFCKIKYLIEINDSLIKQSSSQSHYSYFYNFIYTLLDTQYFHNKDGKEILYSRNGG